MSESESKRQKMTAEVISIGDEMTGGARLDTNTQWLSRRLSELGIEVRFHTTVGDTLSDNVDVFRIAAQRVDVVVATGGLGPTRDDLTREALASAAGEPLEFRQQAMDHIEAIFATRKSAMSDRNRIQAMFPASSSIIANPQGTAPGIDIVIQLPPPVLVEPGESAREPRKACRVFSLPGVPAEMKPMFDQTVAPALMQMVDSGNTIRTLVMKFFGTGESAMEQRLGEMIARDRQPRVGITVTAATISLRITAMADSVEQCQRLIAETKAEILQRLSEYYFGDGENFEQYHAIDSMLRANLQSLLVVELGYAAPLGDWFATLGKTPAYRGGLSLAVPEDLSKITGTDSMLDSLKQLQNRFAADWLLLVNQYPEIPKAADSMMPVTDVSFVVIDPSGKPLTKSTAIGGHPEILQTRIGKGAMAWLRETMRQS